MPTAILNEDQILTALKSVIDPDLNKDIVTLGFIKNLKIDGAAVSFDLELTTPACPIKDQLKSECETNIKALGAESVAINMTSQVRKSAPATVEALKDIKNIIAVASGKGGVGKSTTAVNLAIGLSQSGASVGLLDADIYGPSIPMMLGIDEKPKMESQNKILPLEAHGIKLMSMGFLADENTPLIWRGPMVHNILQQFLKMVVWGEMDYLIIDMPPGTGDAQLTLSQSASLSGAVIVTTPQDISLLDARKGLKMFESVKVPVIGIVETMGTYHCPHCNKTSDIFSHGGAKRVSDELGVHLLGQIPLDPQIVQSGDSGTPIVLAYPDSASSIAYQDFTGKVAQEISILGVQKQGAASNFNFSWK